MSRNDRASESTEGGRTAARLVPEDAQNIYARTVFGLLLILFLVVPLVELFIIIRVDDWLGIWPTIGLLVFNSFLGAWLVRREGLGVIRRVQEQMRAGSMPTESVVDGFLIAFAGALLLTPGFLTDLLGFSQLFPPTRAIVRGLLIKRYGGKMKSAAAGGVNARFGTSFGASTFDSDLSGASPFNAARRRARGKDVVDTDIVDGDVVDDRFTDEPQRRPKEID